jgi:hypothetical protein
LIQLEEVIPAAAAAVVVLEPTQELNLKVARSDLDGGGPWNIDAGDTECMLDQPGDKMELTRS